MIKKLLKISVIIFLTQGSSVFAQGLDSEDAEELNIIEVELERDAQKPLPPAAADEGESNRANENRQDDAENKKTEVNFANLGDLAPFREVSVLQKKYLPKTGRFQLFVGPTLITNDPFFNTYGLAFKAAYFLTEAFGLELNYFALSGSEAKAAKELKEIQNITTDSLVESKSVLGLDLVWVPVYGKMTWFNEKIVPFDVYLSLGYGSTKTQIENAGTLHFATGQIFALSKGTAIRWDLSWNFFNTKGIDQKTASYNNLFMTIGMSWFFPEAKYR